MQVRYVPMMSSAVAVALNFMAYRSDTSTVQPWAVKASLAASLAAALNEPALWWAYTINTFFPAKYKNNQIKTWPTSDYKVTAIRVWRTLTHTEAKMSPANDELYTWSVCSSSKTWGAVLCSSPTHSDAVNQQSSSSVTQPARGRISPRTPHTYMPPLKWGVEFIRHLKPGLCTFYQGNQLESLPVFKLSYTHTHASSISRWYVLFPL